MPNDIKKILKFSSYFYSIAKSELEELPENSDDLKTILKNIDNLETFNAKKKYAEKNLKHLSSGSSRIVYLTPSKTVIKLAKNEKGLAQNKAEANLKIKSKFINKVLSNSKSFSWIEVGFANKITNKQFEKLSKISFDDFSDALRYELRDGKKIKNFDDISKSEIFKEIIKIIKKNDLAVGDICRISSWGQINDQLLLLDVGLTSKIYEKYYE